MKSTKILYFASCVVFVLASEINSTGRKNDGPILSRRKRYVAFPEGSSMIFAICNTAGLIAPFQIFTEGVNWGVSYDLPNSTVLFHPKRYLNGRRQRRELYNSFETVIDAMGYNGKACIYKALCEVPRRLSSRRITLSESLLHVLFRFPQGPISDNEPDDHRMYHWAYRQGRENMQQDCEEMFPACSISLIDLALGYYNDYQEEANYNSLTPNQ